MAIFRSNVAPRVRTSRKHYTPVRRLCSAINRNHNQREDNPRAIALRRLSSRPNSGLEPVKRHSSPLSPQLSHSEWDRLGLFPENM
jgi:hypothetical protein